MNAEFDLFGNPVRTGPRGRGRPAFQVTPEKVNKVRLGLALGWTKVRIANALACSTKTLERYFSPELREREMARDQLDLRRFELIMAEASKGNVGAIKELGRMIEANDRMDASRRMTGKDEAQKAQPAPKLGKKEAARQAAQDVGGDQSEWGNLLKPGYQVN